jgi:DNA-binding MarR family transcriptional regulator
MFVYDLVSFVKRGRVRRIVLENLSRPKTPTQLSTIIGTHRSTVSRALISLEARRLVECITPNEKMMRLYRVTSLGRRVLDKVEYIDD